MKSLILLLLDESGSMESNKEEVIIGFNEFLTKQKDEIGEDSAKGILIKFNSQVTIVNFDPKPIASIPELTTEIYTPAGATALYDAIFSGIRMGDYYQVGFDRILCLIITDGKEKYSVNASAQFVHELLAEKEDGGNGKWTFLYMGEDPEGWVAEGGTSRGNSSSYFHAAPRANFARVSEAVATYRSDPVSTHSEGLFFGEGTEDGEVAFSYSEVGPRPNHPIMLALPIEVFGGYETLSSSSSSSSAFSASASAGYHSGAG